MTAKNLYPLGKVTQIVEDVGMGVAYAHEDLVFLERNAFLLQFTAREDEILVHRNIEVNENELADELGRLREAAKRAGILIGQGCRYRVSEEDKENIRLEFMEEC